MSLFFMANLIDENSFVRKFQINFVLAAISHVTINLYLYKACYNKNLHMALILAFQCCIHCSKLI